MKYVFDGTEYEVDEMALLMRQHANSYGALHQHHATFKAIAALLARHERVCEAMALIERERCLCRGCVAIRTALRGEEASGG